MKEGKPGNTRKAQFGQSDKYQRIRDGNKGLFTHNTSNRGKGVDMLKGEKSTEKK